MTHSKNFVVRATGLYPRHTRARSGPNAVGMKIPDSFVGNRTAFFYFGLQSKSKSSHFCRRMNTNAVRMREFSRIRWYSRRILVTSCCIRNAFRRFVPILVSTPNVLNTLKTFEVDSKWQTSNGNRTTFERLSDSIRNIREAI